MKLYRPEISQNVYFYSVKLLCLLSCKQPSLVANKLLSPSFPNKRTSVVPDDRLTRASLLTSRPAVGTQSRPCVSQRVDRGTEPKGRGTIWTTVALYLVTLEREKVEQ